MATLVRCEPFREIAALQNDMGRLMSAFLGETNGETSRTWVPAVDVCRRGQVLRCHMWHCKT